MSLFGPPDVGKLKARGNVAGLIRALHYRKDETRREALEALVGMGEQAVPRLVAAIVSGSALECEALRRIGVPAVGLLIDALKDDYRRDSAVSVLGEIGDPRAVDPLIRALIDARNRSIDRLGNYDTFAAKAAQAALVQLGASAVQPVSAMLSRTGVLPQARECLARVLGKIGDPRAVESLIYVLENPYEAVQVRYGAVLALGEIGDPRAVEPLIATLADKDPMMREAAVLALGEIGDPRAVEPLTATLADKDPTMQEAAVGALGKIRGPARR